jgi:uncharacterized membrane protein YhfC
MVSPPSAMLLLGGIGMMTVGVFAVAIWRTRRAASWTAFGFGALAWVVSVALKIAWSVPTNTFIQRGLERTLVASIAVPTFWLYIGLLTGIFECGITMFGASRTRFKAAHWNEAVAFGIGFGAVEAFLLGILDFVGLVAVIAFWDEMSEDTKQAVAARTQFGMAEVSIVTIERLSALAAHVFTCVLIIYAVRIGQLRWFWLSFVFKSALDAFAAWGILAGRIKQSLFRLTVFEVAVGVFAVIALVGLASLRRRFKEIANPIGTFTGTVASLSVLLLVTSSSLVPATCRGQETPKADASSSVGPKLSDLRSELVGRAKNDQQTRNLLLAWLKEHGHQGNLDRANLAPIDSPDYERLQARIKQIDSENTKRLEDVIEEYGWPRISVVGKDGSHAAWLLVQHADADPGLQRKCLDLMTSLPKTEVSQVDLAYLADRVLLAEGRKQLYGTQFTLSDGAWQPRPIEDAANVEKRRAEVGLPPLADYIKQLKAAYGEP